MSLFATQRTNAPDRLAAVRRTALLDTPAEERFDRLTRLAARLLGTPVALISLVTEDRQFFKSAAGLPEPWATRRGAPLAYSICRHVVDAGVPLAVEDVRRHPLLRSNLAARELGWVAYAGVPLMSHEGHVLGTLSVVDVAPRLWSERDLTLLQDLAACAVSEIELRVLRAQAAPPAQRPGNGLAPALGGIGEVGIPLGLVSSEGRWVRVNRALAEFLGHSEAKLVGEPAERFTHPDDRPADREALRLLLAGECDSYTGEKRCLRRSGEVAWVLATVTVVGREDGAGRQLLVGFQDITDRKAAESALRASEERYRLAVRATSDAVRDWDLATDRVVWGDGLEPVFGWSAPPVATAAWWYERIHPDERERVVAAIQAAISRGERTWELEYRFRRADGGWARVADRGFVVSEGGEAVRLLGAMADVGERREAEEALRRNEARYRSVLDHLREVVFQTDLAGRWVLLNPAWEELTGFAVAECLGTPFLDYVHPDDRARNAREFEPLITGRKRSSRYEVRYLTRDGAFRWVEVQARLTLDERGEPTGTTGSLTDQTERKRAELLSIGQSRLLEEIASGAALGRVLDGIVRFAEEHAAPCVASLLRLRPEGGDLTLASGPRLPDALRRALETVPVGPHNGSCGTAAHRRELVAVRDIESDPLWQGWPYRDLALAAGLRSCWSVPILAVTGEVLGTLAIYHPVTREPAVEDLRIVEIATHLAGIAIERERTQEAVRRSTRLLEQVLQTLPIGVWVLGPDGRILFGNRAGQQVWGRGAEAMPAEFGELRGWWAKTGQPIAAEEWPAVRAIRNGETTIDQLVRIETLDGRERTILDSAVPIRDEAGEVAGAIVVNQDITERYEAEAALRRSEAQLRQAQKMEAVGQLAGGIAHDFNNLLTGILSYCDLILQELRGSDPIRTDVEQIRHAGLRAAALTRQLLAFSRRQVLQPRVLSLNTTIADIDGMLRRLVGADVTLETELDPALWYVLADPGQIEQVLVNLVVNARDAMPRGGRVRIATANHRYPASGEERPNGVRPGHYVAVSVADTGIGMDVQTQARVFEPFFTTKEQGKGTGLGLSTVYGIVQQSGGHITVESAPAQGATFTIFLPRHEGGAAALPAHPERRTLPGGRETLLLVEDEAAVRTSARRLLERYGYTVLEARHGADALRILDELEADVDLVLTDLVMPEMGGRELVERLRARRPTLKVLFMSGYTEKAIAIGGMMPPHTGFVEKPFTVEQLLRRLREILDE